MTWRKEDTIGTGVGKLRGARTPGVPVDIPQDLVDAEGEPTMSVFQAMGVGTQGGIWGAEHERFPYEVERQLAMECGIVPERHWQAWKKCVFRDTEAV